ncbi:MAG: endonuclease/exonuclease/phosphatase family protein, partial [Pseudomonadota bacterium]
YHHFHKRPQGNEPHPTLYWRDRTQDGPTYHIDYVFIPKHWRKDLRNVHIGEFGPWCGAKLSDHTPVSVDIA